MATFNLKSILKGYKKLFGMTAEVYNENGDLLDSVDINNTGKRISFQVDKDDAFQGAKKADFTFKLTDNNGDDHNLTRRGGRLYDLDSDEQTFTETISAKKRSGKAKLRPDINEIEQPQPNTNESEQGKTIELTPLLDNITATDLSSTDDVITAELGTLGVDFKDSITDNSTTDNDLLVVKTNSQFDIEDSLADNKITRIQNIETIQVVANNDDVGNNFIDLDDIVNLKKLDIDGTFIDNLVLEEWADTSATEFDFSDVTSTQGVALRRNAAGNLNFTGDIVFKGSAGGDTFEGLVGNVIMNGGSGNDTLIGSRAGTSKISGGAGTDEIDLWDHNAQHTISLAGQTSQTSKDIVVFDSFQGFNNVNAQALNTFDLIEIDAATFTNYTARQSIQQQDVFNINASTNLSNTIVTTISENNLAQGTGFNFDNNGNGLLGFAADTGTLIYSESGNFRADAQELLQIGGAEGGNFVPARQINVI